MRSLEGGLWKSVYGKFITSSSINKLNSQALADVSGAGSGSIRVQAQNLEMRDGSVAPARLGTYCW